MKLKGSLNCKDHKMEFEILRAARKVHRKLTSLDFRRPDFGLLRDLLHRVSWDKTKKAGWYSRITSSKLRSDLPNKEKVK